MNLVQNQVGPNGLILCMWTKHDHIRIHAKICGDWMSASWNSRGFPRIWVVCGAILRAQNGPKWVFSPSFKRAPNIQNCDSNAQILTYGSYCSLLTAQNPIFMLTCQIVMPHQHGSDWGWNGAQLEHLRFTATMLTWQKWCATSTHAKWPLKTYNDDTKQKSSDSDVIRLRFAHVRATSRLIGDC